MPTLNWPRPALMLAVLALLLTACAAPPTPTLPPSVVAPPRIPPLPQAARQPPAPAWCSPTCSAALTRERENWLQRLTLPMPPASPASGPMTR